LAFWNQILGYSRSLQDIENLNFFPCDNLKTISISPENYVFAFQNGILSSGNFRVLHFADHATERIELPSQVEFIRGSAFCYCRSLKEVVFMHSHFSIIGPFAFALCTIQEIVLPERVVKIEASAFVCCLSLMAVKVPPLFRLEDIGRRAFHMRYIEAFDAPIIFINLLTARSLLKGPQCKTSSKR
jgi:hypothetical protein